MKTVTALGVGFLALLASLTIAHAASAPAPVVVTVDRITKTDPMEPRPIDRYPTPTPPETGLRTPPGASQSVPKGRCPEWEPQIAAAGLPPIFSAIMHRESRCQERVMSAVRYTGEPDVGLLQIQGTWKTVTQQVCGVPRSEVIEALRRANCNLAVAGYLYRNGGLAHWGF
jgi:hypothetical protein